MNERSQMSRVEGRVERWWISSIMHEGGVPIVYGDFYGLASIGYEEGKFDPMEGIEQIDFVRGFFTTDKAIIKLGSCQTMDRALAEVVARAQPRHNPVRKPDKE